MRWLQEAAKVLVQEGLPVIWTAPSGLPIIQAYPKQKSKTYDLMVQGRFQIKLREDTGKLDAKQQENGISPNFVHSMDAAALIQSVNLAASRGVEAFAMIHDSYATVAADTQALAVALREAFVGMYQEDVLEKFRQEASRLLSEGKALPPIPDKGTLELGLVLKSKFFFA
jgi:DNA-directed RNA polymerase